ncbi:MAG TPA: M56 family metallopeptidase, partial [Lacipirellulaceae bacterium]|nr:M56 family metallopeptidase [Lacipirellulaceae bacterium]
MTQLAEAFAWCMLQVSIFTLLVACFYLAAKRLRWGGSTALLLAGLGVVGLLTALSVSPWPQWIARDVDGNQKTIIQRDLSKRELSLRSNRASRLEQSASTERRIEQALRAVPGEPDAQNFPVAAATSPRLEYAASWWIVAVGVAWTASAIGFIRFLVAFASLRRLRNTSIRIDDLSLLSSLNELRREMKVEHAVHLRESQSLGVAATCGWRRPMILLPAMWRQWTPDERRAVLAHELAHIRESHYPRLLCSQMAVVAHYYHPIVQWLARQLRFEQEVAADVLAARAFGDSRRYASALATLALGAAPPSGAVGSLGLFMSKPFLMRRLAMLRQGTDAKHLSGRVKRPLPISLVIVVGIAVAGVRADDPSTTGESASRASNSPQDVATIESKSTAQDAINTAVAFLRASKPERYATALFRVSREQARLLEGSSLQSDAAWEFFCKTQIALLKSYFVLQAAVRNPEIAALPMLASADYPVNLLAQRLEVGFYPGSEILYVRMGCSRGNEADQAVKIVNAVAKAYEDEVIFKDRQRQASSTDLLARSYKKLNEEIRQKMEDYQEISREAGLAESGAGQVAQQLDIRRLERVEEELMRLENDFVELQTSGKTGNTKFFEERIAQLSKRQEELERKIIDRSQPSAELSERRRELERLQRIADELS